MGEKILGLNKKTFWLVILIVGGLLFVWATAQISNIPSDYLLFEDQQAQTHASASLFTFLQIIAALAVIIGGVQTYRIGGTKG